MKSYTVTFAYNRMDPAETIYANLERTAMKACRDITASSIHAAVATRKCAKQVITSALDAMNRTDVAAIHSDRHA